MGLIYMASDRITRSTAELVALPPITVVQRTPKELLEMDFVQKIKDYVPVNVHLLDSIKRDGILNPILVGSDFYPIAGSQRVRCFLELQDDEALMNTPITIHRFDKDYWNVFYLWGDIAERDKIISLWFQLVELAWKSKTYNFTEDSKGLDMKYFESEGHEEGWPLV